MVVIDVYGKIEKILISDKLKLYISNVPDDWKEEIIEDMVEEIRQQKVDIKNNVRRYGKSNDKKYTISYLRKIIKTNIEDYPTDDLDSIENCIECLVDNMVCIFFDYNYSDMPFFDWTTNCFDGRLCEEDYAEKVVYFINFVNDNISNSINLNIVYSSNSDLLVKSRILLNLSFRIRSGHNDWKSKDEYIINVQKMGARIDDILNTDNDYYKLDYIMNGIYQDNNYNQNHYLKSFSLLELALLKPSQETGEIDKLLVPFLDNIYGEDSEDVVILLRQMRNKIGHGDFKGFNNKSEIFAQKFMKDYQFDYTEYSRLNWILLHTCGLLDDLLREVLFYQLKNS